MGRHRWSHRQLVERSLGLSIYWLRSQGYFSGRYRSGAIEWTKGDSDSECSIGIEVSLNEHQEGGYARLSYTMTNSDGEKKSPLDYNVKIVSTPCNYGKVRYWFICPLITDGITCNRRVAKLYLPSGRDYFGCRHCHDLTYRSQKSHNKRVDALLKDPNSIYKLLKTGKGRDSCLAMEALFKLEGK